MDSFLKDVLATVFISTLNELMILSHGKNLQFSTLKKGVCNKNLQPKTELNSLNNLLPVATLNEIKLSKDLKKIVDIHLETLEELQVKGTFGTLLAAIYLQQKKMKEEENLFEEHKSSLSLLKNLTARLSEFKTEADAKVLQASETLNNLKSEWRIISKVNELEYELVKKWEHTCFTQATILGEMDEDALERKLADLTDKIKAEQRVISDFKAFSKHQCNQYTELIEMWKERYAKEMKTLVASIADKKARIKDVEITYEKHFEIFCKRKQFIEEYLEQKAEENRLLQWQIKQNQSAVTIQAWWRGVMVRRCLGPYKKKGKKGKKSKKSK